VVSFVKEQLGKSVGNGNSHLLLLEHAKLLKELTPHRWRR
jgi:hypothetical protein